MTVFERYRELNIDRSLISLEDGLIEYPHFCYPINAEVIGFEGCILYCFLPEYGEMVFASNPESCADKNVYPLAANFEDFLRLVIACGSANPVEQIVWMSKAQFEEHLLNECELQTAEHMAVIETLCQKLQLSPMENPFEYVKSMQVGFDDSKIKYSDEYYDVLGLEVPAEKNRVKYPCPCCGYLTFPVPKEDAVAYICPVCYWENDVFIKDADECSDENHGLTLNEAKKNFREFGASDERMLQYVRPPREDEK